MERVGCSETTWPTSPRSEEHTSELQSRQYLVCRPCISTLFPYPTLFRSSVMRTIGAFLGIGFLALQRVTGRAPQAGKIKTAATAAGIIGLLRSFPFVRNGARRLLGDDMADLA